MLLMAYIYRPYSNQQAQGVFQTMCKHFSFKLETYLQSK